MLNVKSRSLEENTNVIRKRGYIPGNIYGKQLEKSIPVEVYITDFKRLVESNGHKGVLEVNLNGDVKSCKIREVQVDSIKGYLHINFLLV